MRPAGVRDDAVRVIHVVTGLGLGGAEIMLARLAVRLQARGLPQEVISLKPEGPVADLMRQLGLRPSTLELRGPHELAAGLLRLIGELRRLRPDVVHCWMYPADLVGGFAARLAGCGRVAWSLQGSDLDPVEARLFTRLCARACALASRRLPDRIVSVSRRATDFHVGLGYDASRIVHVPNGFDVDAFAPAATRAGVEAELGVPTGSRLVGTFARFDPQKDVRTFLRAAARLAAADRSARFVMAGTGMTGATAQLREWASECGVAQRLHLLGPRRDVARLMAAMDVVTTSSAFGEAFPVTIGEAMACGVACVVTDVGDSAELVGDAGLVVPPRDPAALAAAWSRLLSDDGLRRALAARARQRIVARFSLDAVASRYEGMYRELAAG